MPPPKWTKCEIRDGKPYIIGPKHTNELTINTQPRHGQYGVKLNMASKTRFCAETSRASFLKKLNSIALHNARAAIIDNPGIDFVDMCKLSPELVASFKQGKYDIPSVKVTRGSATKGRVLNISSDLVIRINKTSIAAGANGEVFGARGPRGPYEDLVVKRNNGDVDEKGDFIEVLIQTILFCDQRAKGNFQLSQLAAEYKIRTPLIPKVVYYAKAKNTTGSFIVMEKVDETLEDFARRRNTTRVMLIDCLKQLCILLQYLQQEFKFMHRDMHASNVMVKYIVHGGKRGFRVALIDFGMSRIEAPVGTGTSNIQGTTKKKNANGTTLSLGFPSGKSSDTFDEDHVYQDANDFNSSLDLVMMFAYLYQLREFNTKLPEIRDRVIVPVFKQIFNRRDKHHKHIKADYLKRGGVAPTKGEFDKIRVELGHLHHIFYNDAVKTEFKACTPKNVLGMLCKLK